LLDDSRIHETRHLTITDLDFMIGLQLDTKQDDGGCRI
jgi:hypothetical protein